jgi:hypothetical protein
VHSNDTMLEEVVAGPGNGRSGPMMTAPLWRAKRPVRGLLRVMRHASRHGGGSAARR